MAEPSTAETLSTLTGSQSSDNRTVSKDADLAQTAAAGFINCDDCTSRGCFARPTESPRNAVLRSVVAHHVRSLAGALVNIGTEGRQLIRTVAAIRAPGTRPHLRMGRAGQSLEVAGGTRRKARGGFVVRSVERASNRVIALDAIRLREPVQDQIGERRRLDRPGPTLHLAQGQPPGGGDRLDQTTQKS